MNIKGGFTSYMKVVDVGLNSPSYTFKLIYSPDTGFYLQSNSSLTPEGHVNLGRIYYSPTSGCFSHGNKYQYKLVRSKIINTLNTNK
jgi:hypothetical protein